MLRPGMRAYLFPLVAGVALAASAFLPWIVVEDISLAGVPDTAGLWIAGLGTAAALLATLSLITRKNSRSGSCFCRGGSCRARSAAAC